MVRRPASTNHVVFKVHIEKYPTHATTTYMSTRCYRECVCTWECEPPIHDSPCMTRAAAAPMRPAPQVEALCREKGVTLPADMLEIAGKYGLRLTVLNAYLALQVGGDQGEGGGTRGRGGRTRGGWGGRDRAWVCGGLWEGGEWVQGVCSDSGGHRAWWCFRVVVVGSTGHVWGHRACDGAVGVGMCMGTCGV